MIKYAKIKNKDTGICEVGIGDNDLYYKSIGMNKFDVELSEIDNNWYLKEKCPHYSEEELKLKEKERILNLKMTPRDFLLSIIDLGVSWNDIKQMLSQNPRAEIELNYCQFVYRGNPLLNELSGQFGISETQLDNIFLEKGN